MERLIRNLYWTLSTVLATRLLLHFLALINHFLIATDITEDHARVQGSDPQVRAYLD